MEKDIKEIRNLLRMILIIICQLGGLDEEQTKNILNKTKED